ncbi:MAG: L-lactate dehydrogenase (quinone) large subunit LdhH [Candidatus Methylomirabilales bacterium]|nr:LUD domain-containing protein [candidate division NC10 bacterium]
MTRQEEFRRRASEALANPRIRENLGRFGTAYRTARENALAVLDYKGERARLRRVKEDAIERLPELSQQFVESARRVGAFVYEARTAEEANRYIGELAKARGVELVVKSKSMVTEEIGLNRYLEELGITPLEADLGEWIIQQANEHPSHSVMPCIHMSKEEVAGIFSKALRREVPPDINLMVRLAREELRGKFLSAGMGISGANIAVAETGTIIIVTNEGNGRLATSLPPIHVALLGYDKIVPTIEEAASHLKLLSKTATAQQLTVYTTFITGKTGASQIPRPREFRGPATGEMHIVLLDNGRWAMRDNPEFKEALYCIRCASCANVCPTYRVVGGHVFGHIYTGVIGVVITPFHHGWEAAAVPQEACLLCRACYDACPVEIDLPRMIVAMRSQIVEQEEHKKKAKGIRRLFLDKILPNPTLFNLTLRLGAIAQLPFTRGRTVLRELPWPLKNLSSIRAMPALATRPLRSRVGEVLSARGEAKRTVTFFGSCLIDQFYPEIGEAVIKVLNHYGVTVHYPKGQSCCGLPAYYEGHKETATRMARDLIAALEANPDEQIVTATPPCGITLKQYVPKLVKGDPLWEERGRSLAARTSDFSEYLVEVLGLGDETLGSATSEKVPLAYHDSCSALRGLRVQEPQRRLLGMLGRYELRELDEIGECCGFGGHFSADYPDVAGEVLKRKIAAIERTGARVVALDSPGCLLQIRGGLLKQGSPIEVRHIAELLAEAL